MPLPNGGGPWPPKELAPVHDRLTMWSAWYAGEPDMLASVYGGQTGAGDQTRTGFFASQQGGFKASVRNFFQRWFWGTATPSTEQRTKLHVPVAGDLAATSADLLFSEPPTMTVDDEKTQDRLNDLADDHMHAAFLQAAEIGAALGGSYLRVCWDKDIEPDRPFLDVVHADHAVPDFRYGRLVAVTFWQILQDDGKQVIRHLERHEPGVILHGVYAGTRTELGRRIALTDMPETEDLAKEITDNGDQISTGAKVLTASYLPNIRPNRIWRGVPAAAHLGRSDYAGIESLMDALDETYSSLMRDIRLAKARLIVPESYLQSQGRGKGAIWDSEQEVIYPVDTLMSANPQGGLAITPNQFQIRVTEHLETAKELVAQIVRGAGYSVQTFGAAGEVAVTATEVSAKERRSDLTRDKKITYMRPGIALAVEALLAVDAAQFRSGVTPERPVIEFGDRVSEDPQVLAQTAQLWLAAEAAATETRVRHIHPDWDDVQVGAEVKRIKEEQPSPLGDAFSGPGSDGGMGPSGPGASSGEPDDMDAAFDALGGGQ